MDEYRALMEEVESPDTVHEGILAEVERVRREERRKARAPHARRAAARGNAATAPAPASAKRRRWMPVLAGACALVVVAALVPFGGQLAGLLGDAGGGVGGGLVGQAFSVRAYASDTRTLVPPTDNGMIVFDRSGGLTTMDKDWYLQYGKYTGCMFTVEGEGIVRIQATTSAGMLYRNSYETVNRRDDPERTAELDLWKPSKAGLGEYYGLYENVAVVETVGESDQDREMTVRLTKMLGSTIDLPINPEDDSDAKSFGLWTNEDYGDVADTSEDPLASTDAVFDTFEGETITVTAYFEDGSCATQTIELHTADFKATMDDPMAFYGYGAITVYPEIIDRSTLPNVYGEGVSEGAPFALHSLYGVIVDETDEPHPFPLDNANEWLDVTVPFTFERGETFYSMGDAVLVDEAISDPDERVTVSVPADPRNGAQDREMRDIEVANLRIERSELLPFGLAIEDTITYGGYRGDFAYANKVSEETSGYRIEDDSSLTPGFSYRTVTFEVTNPSDEETSLSVSTLARFAVRDDDEGHYSTLAATPVWATGYDGRTNSGQEYVLAPHETRDLSVVYVVPDVLDELDDPLFNLSWYGTDGSAFRIKSLL